DGALDPSFGEDGVVLDLRQQVAGGGQVATLPDGRVFVVEPGFPQSIYQFLEDGSPDPSFGDDGIVTPVSPGARVLRRATADWLTTSGNSIRVINADGSEGPIYVGMGPQGRAGGFQEVVGGLYVIGGDTLSLIGEPSDLWAARFRPGDDSGSLISDPCFGGTGSSRTYDFGESLGGADSAVQSDGRVVLVGATRDRGDDDDLVVVRIRPDGEIDRGFGTDGIVYLDFGGDDRGRAVAIDDQGRIVVVGSSRVGDAIFGDRFAVMARLLP
ncbi:MAG TPA: delta-60 repeat domain-containing protein, partial [Polyangiales bacterium]|nr:delta-60 repeat domain-containing protein [Polyangiales bacterium]